MDRSHFRTTVLLFAAGTMVGLTAFHDASAADKVRVRGTVESLDGNTLKVKNGDGKEVVVTMTPGFNVLGVKNASSADIKPGDFVGIGSQPTSSGINGAVQIVIFPASMKGTGEGDRPWDVKPNGTMTNGTVANAVKDVNGPMLTLAYKGGQRKVSIPDGTKIVALAPATKDDLKPGAGVSLQGIGSGENMVTADRIAVGVDGATPP
jgi:hypothetical protein